MSSVSGRSAARVYAPLAVLAASVACAVGALILKSGGDESLAEGTVLYLSFLSVGFIGSILLVKGGSRIMGWIFMAIAFLWTSGDGSGAQDGAACACGTVAEAGSMRRGHNFIASGQPGQVSDRLTTGIEPSGAT